MILIKPRNIFRIGGDKIFNHFLLGDEFFENRGKNELKNSIGDVIFSIIGVKNPINYFKIIVFPISVRHLPPQTDKTEIG